MSLTGGAPGFRTLHIIRQVAQRTYTIYGVRITTFGSCPQRWHGSITARRSRFSVMRVEFAMWGTNLPIPANTFIGPTPLQYARFPTASRRSVSRLLRYSLIQTLPSGTSRESTPDERAELEAHGSGSRRV